MKKKPMVTEIERILMIRDGMTSAEAKQSLEEARQRIREGELPEDILEEELCLELDYVFDLLDDLSFTTGTTQ